jgi:N-acetylglucosaminyldiphosphoundecaprenol N-acetyl-beta-D-mannosaminyltransferase
MESTLTCEATRRDRLVNPATVHIGGVRFDAIDRREALETMVSFVEEGGPHLVSASNLDCVVQSQRDPIYREVINRSSLSLADGMGIVYASRLIGCPLPENVCGRLILVDFCRVAAERGYRVFLLGGGPGIAATAANALTAMFPALQIAGTFSPPFEFELSSDENEKCVRAVRAAAPDVLFVAFGAPRQEKWLSRKLSQLDVSLAMGVGYTLDLLAGQFPVPPNWMTSVGLEWAFRLCHDPVRLAKRYLWRDIGFVPILLSEIWNQRISRLRAPVI